MTLLACYAANIVTVSNRSEPGYSHSEAITGNPHVAFVKLVQRLSSGQIEAGPAAGAEPEFRGDREQLIQAVLNIAHNACQALSDRIAAGDAQLVFRTRIARQVTFGKQRYRLALELHVIDNGPGVPHSIRDRIFFPLVSGREGGSGLGLTLAQTFVQQHHGLIECDSVSGRTDFKILIPLP